MSEASVTTSAALCFHRACTRTAIERIRGHALEKARISRAGRRAGPPMAARRAPVMLRRMSGEQPANQAPLRVANADARLLASLYAAVHRGTPGDVDFHLAECAGAPRVLELGCGHGRIARALAEAGHHVVGIDLDEAQLALGAKKKIGASARSRLTLRHGDMRALDLPTDERFDRVLVAYSTLYCLASDDEIRAMLAGAREHLAPGGRIVIDAYAADGFHAELDPYEDDDFEEVARVRVAGKTWRVLERSDWDRPAQRVTARYRHVPTSGRTIETTIEHRYVLAAQLEALLRAEGLRATTIAGGFDRRPWDDEAEQLVVVAEHASGARRAK